MISTYNIPTGFQGHFLNSFGTKFNLDKELLGKVPHFIEGFTDNRWKEDTYFSHYKDPFTFMKSLIDIKEEFKADAKKVYKYSNFIRLVEQGEKEYENIDAFDVTYSTIFESASKIVKDKLVARGLINKYLSGSVEMTNIPTGVLSHTQVALGRPDCWIKSYGVTDGNIFYDLYINLSYSYDVADEEIAKNAYAIYALVQVLAKVIPMRVYVVNHVGIGEETICYSYCLKEYGRAINPKEFLFFLTKSKRTFGWASYDLLEVAGVASVGNPKGTLKIDSLNLDNIIDTVIDKISKANPYMIQKT